VELHLCEIRIQNTNETIKYYEITVRANGKELTAWQHPTWEKARWHAAHIFENDIRYTPSLKKKVNGRDWCVDSVRIN
jgi:hypothetical protein